MLGRNIIEGVVESCVFCEIDYCVDLTLSV